MHDNGQRRKKCGPEPLERPRWISPDSLRRPRTKLAEVPLIRFADVVDDLGQAAPPASRTEPQAFPAGLVRRLVERLPARGQKLDEAPELLVIQGPRIRGKRHPRRPEIGRW